MAKDKKKEPARPTVKPTPTKAVGGKARTELKLVGSENEDLYPFKVAQPEDFDFEVHKSLKKRDFTADHLFYEHKALEMDFKAKNFRAQAEEAKRLGSAKDRVSARRLLKLQDKMSEIKAQLTEQGVDVNALLRDAAVKIEGE